MKKFISWRHPGTISIFRMDDRLLLIGMGIIVGLCSGLAALALNHSLIFMLEFLHDFRHYWWAFLLPAAGAMCSSLFLEKIMNEGAGHGVPEVIYSVSRYGGLIRLRSSISRLVSSCLTIGSGGSAGPEAPVVMSGSAIGSNIAQFFFLNDRQRITLVGCGAAGAVASIFNAPLTGIIFTMEIILGEWSMVNIIPIAVASVAGAELSRTLRGNIIAFESSGSFHIGHPDLFACIGLAMFAALASVLFTRTLRRMHKVSRKVSVPFWVRAAIGGCAVGLLGFMVPEVMGEGYHAIHDMIEGVFKGGIGIVALACLAKILATALTLGWGGSGGIFAPSLVIGSFAGLAYHRLLVFLFPSVMWVSEGCFALLGMAGMMSGILQAPLTGIFLILEITGSYEVMLPLIIVSALSTTMTHYFEPSSFYFKELMEKGQLLRPGTDSRVLADISIREVIEKDCICVRPDMLLREFLYTVQRSTRNYFPVEDQESGQFVGMIRFDQIKPYFFNSVMYDTVIVEQIMDANPDTVHYDDELSEVLNKMDTHGHFSLPVVFNGRFVGMVSKATLLDKYRDELNVQTAHSF
ncbi:Putative chloride channel protein [Desulfamplus magnetovallimortis]|uniref:Putative chloride channel protein n=1 Tax=Desulfamplus magnetovallimortis TaxID=1246637 RepID=A0A1W1H4H7_9BACT|nr:chloride channel protein [Desulfamplus magnetovallimortis]SLM27380.1 Putative chloride channel protein [Desulfamplus magnetovallimortis]